MRRAAWTLAVAGALAASCGGDDSDPAHSGGTMDGGGGSGGSGQPDSSVDSGSGAGEVTPEAGGTITAGGTTVSVPPGAVSEPTTITIQPIDLGSVAGLPAGFVAVGPAVALLPHGLTFSAPVEVTLRHSSSSTAGLAVLRLDDERDTTWETVANTSFSAMSASFETTSFSVVVPVGSDGSGGSGGAGGTSASGGGAGVGGTGGTGAGGAGGTAGSGGGSGGAVMVEPQISAGVRHTCAVLRDGSVRCWGDGGSGRLGYGNTENIGDDEAPSSAGTVDVGGPVMQVAAGLAHTCALLTNGNVRCWGDGQHGRLGYANEDFIGDDEPPATAGDVDIGGTVTQIAAGWSHNCAVLDTGNVRCWGYGFNGRLGYGSTAFVGDDETPASAGDVDVGGTVTQVAAGESHTCALLATGAVKCWGYGFEGALGYGNSSSIGDVQTPASVGTVDVGGTVAAIDAGGSRTCALLTGGTVRCWGTSGQGALGYGDTMSIGDDETPATAGDVSVGGLVAQIGTGGGLTSEHTCALLVGGSVRCWGNGQVGMLGYGNTMHVGNLPDNLPSHAGDLNLGGTAVRITVGGLHNCALLSNDAVRCWGFGVVGQLGYGNTNNIGDDETPADAGDVPFQ